MGVLKELFAESIESKRGVADVLLPQPKEEATEATEEKPLATDMPSD